MCIRDSPRILDDPRFGPAARKVYADAQAHLARIIDGRELRAHGCLLYTSDAADERSSVDLGGRRLIKKNKNKQQHTTTTLSQT